MANSSVVMGHRIMPVLQIKPTFTTEHPFWVPLINEAAETDLKRGIARTILRWHLMSDGAIQAAGGVGPVPLRLVEKVLDGIAQPGAELRGAVELPGGPAAPPTPGLVEELSL